MDAIDTICAFLTTHGQEVKGYFMEVPCRDHHEMTHEEYLNLTNPTDDCNEQTMKEYPTRKCEFVDHGMLKLVKLNGQLCYGISTKLSVEFLMDLPRYIVERCYVCLSDPETIKDPTKCRSSKLIKPIADVFRRGMLHFFECHANYRFDLEHLKQNLRKLADSLPSE